jgi:antitoxin component YwqK of YwqJK toxin-antitoxin module
MSKKIKNETVYRVNHLPGEEIDVSEEHDSKQSYHEFNEDGNLLLEIAYTQDGEVADKIEYRYDKNGRLLETKVYGEDEEVLERKEVVRDNNGRAIREITHYLDGSADIHEYYYNEDGLLTGFQVKDDEDEIESSEKYIYEGDKVVKVERWDGDNELIFSQEDKYENGVILSRKIWSAEDEEPYTFITEYNAAGHRVQERRFNSRDQLIERNIYEEDGNGRVVRIIEENKQRKNTTEFEFDERGNLIHQAETDLNGDLNHEVFRQYSDDGELLITTVEAVVKASGTVRAYSMIFRRDYY